MTFDRFFTTSRSTDNNDQHVSAGFFDQTSTASAPKEATYRVAEVVGKGIANLPYGLLDTAIDDINHPVAMAERIGSSVAVGATFRLLFPEANAVSGVAALAVGAGFLLPTIRPVMQALQSAKDAKTVGQMNRASMQFADGVGALTLNSMTAAAFAGLGSRVMANTREGRNFYDLSSWVGVTDAKAPQVVGPFYGSVTTDRSTRHLKNS